MQRHDRHFLALLRGLIVHDQADVFEEPLQGVVIFQRFHELLEVFQPTGGFGRLIVLPEPRIAAFIKDRFGQCQVINIAQRVAGHLVIHSRIVVKDLQYRPQ